MASRGLRLQIFTAMHYFHLDF
eukprot:COSAG02_NODE_33336_length_501_cov_1.609453_1_plen_21_part_01